MDILLIGLLALLVVVLFMYVRARYNVRTAHKRSLRARTLTRFLESQLADTRRELAQTRIELHASRVAASRASFADFINDNPDLRNLDFDLESDTDIEWSGEQ